MNGEQVYPPEFLARAEAKLNSDKAASEATRVAMPGPLRQIIKPQDIQVGEYKIRPFYDIDFEILQVNEHPLAAMADSGKKFGTIADMRGKHAWLACWLLAHTVDETDLAFQDGTLVEKARKEFGRKQIGELVELMNSVITQYAVYFSTVVEMGDSSAESGSEKKSTELMTASAGCSKNVAL